MVTSIEVSHILYFSIVGFFIVERLFELRLSAKHAEWAFSQGGIEVGIKHFAFMRLIHSLFFISVIIEVIWLPRPFSWTIAAIMTAFVVLSQLLRYWAISSLGRYWNVRIIVVPQAKVVSSGPYRYLKHPNYLAVIIEFFALPLIHQAYLSAIIFSMLNALVLWIRIPAEERALKAHTNYSETFGALK